jgi:hypothetical protein
MKKRFASPTPSFWQKIRNIALIVAATGGAVLAAPVTLPAAVATTLGYVVAVASAIAGTAQMTKQGE